MSMEKRKEKEGKTIRFVKIINYDLMMQFMFCFILLIISVYD